MKMDKILFCWDVDTENSTGKRRKFYRQLYGYNLENNGKEYEYPGLLQKVDGERVNQSVVVVPEKESGKIQRLLSEYEEIFGSRESFKIREQ